MVSMASFVVEVAIVALAVSFVPSSDADAEGFVPGEDTVYSTYNGTAAPYPSNISGAIFPTAQGPPGADDLIFQNLLAAEWIVFNFYQQGVEAFTASNFTDAGYKPTTYQRITEIRDNEAGHLHIFINSISNTSLKPGPCKYDYDFSNNVETYLVILSVLEVTSMAFLTALIQEAQLNATKGALVAIGEVEGRHLTWALIDVWNTDPFSGPSDTVYPYVNQILETTNEFVIPGSCPVVNPVYPYPRQNLPQLTTQKLFPGSSFTFKYSNASHVPSFNPEQQYYAVFFHGILSISVPFDPKKGSSVVPSVFENRGIIIAILADQEGAPTEDSVVAGPLVITLQPAAADV